MIEIIDLTKQYGKEVIITFEIKQRDRDRYQSYKYSCWLNSLPRN